ncbi:MAG: hypothetical protein DRH97_01940 [Chloroflexi bacterium]|nr:hypothetical protein [Gammaproteobacteria bacterium]RLC68830.1 MAG: hypothetical protein DRH97_01940 [Chloroflexota bacterium]
MSIVITDEGAAVRITGLGRDGDKDVDFTKDDLSLTVDDDRVAVSDGRNSYVVVYTDVTTPAGLTSAEDLRDFINGLLPTGGGGGGGDATAANQATQISLATDTNTKLDTLIAAQVAGSITSGFKDVATAGTAEALGASTAIVEVIVTAKEANTGTIYVGGAGVASTNGTPLEAEEVAIISIDDLAKVFIDSDFNGEGVTFNYLA